MDKMDSMDGMDKMDSMDRILQCVHFRLLFLRDTSPHSIFSCEFLKLVDKETLKSQSQDTVFKSFAQYLVDNFAIYVGINAGNT